MRFIDLLRMAAKNLKGKWVVLPIIGIAISMFCLCFAGATLKSVQDEKSLPHVLKIGAGISDVTDTAIADISKIPDVTTVMPILEIPASIKIDESTMEMTLIGISTDFFTEAFIQGGAYPENSIMPYMVMNEAVGNQFLAQQDDGGFGAEAVTSEIDWTNKKAAISTAGEGQWIVSKISGVLAGDEQQESSIYISIATAKELLLNTGQSTDYIGANVRITNIGYSESVSKAIFAFGLNVSNANEELQNKWDTKMREMTYLVVVGLFCLLCSSVLLSAWRKNSLLEQKETFITLRWMGMKESEIGRLFVIQAAMIALLGIAIGILVSTSLPSFLSIELQGTSIFTFSIPFQAVYLSTAICLLPVILKLLTIKSSITNVLD